jgi:hypothetical protein
MKTETEELDRRIAAARRVHQETVVAVLFARSDSHYKSIAGCDVWDKDRNALNWVGGSPVVAHPPCRAWGRLRQFAQPAPGEKEFALWAVAKVRKWGGVLEHPAQSTLWPIAGLPKTGQMDDFGGWTLPINQHSFGHRAEKKTWLYVVGCEPRDIPSLPIRLGRATHCIRPTKSYPRLPCVTKAEREHTPPMLANWLVELARKCVPHAQTPVTKCRFCGMALEVGRDPGACRQCETDIERAARLVR